jgi:hypothetical protein
VILNTILTLFRDYKPLTFFGSIGLVFIVVGCVPGAILLLDFLRTGVAHNLAVSLLAVGTVLSGMLLIVVGLVLHTITRRFQELEYQLKIGNKEVDMDRFVEHR